MSDDKLLATAADYDADDFDWHNDDSVVIAEQPSVAAYHNPDGAIIIRQRAWPDEDPFVIVQRQNLRSLITRLIEIERGER